MSDVAEVLEAITRRPAWHADGACKEHPELTWFPERGQSAGAAKLVCRGCLVAGECLEWSLRQSWDLDGIFGGLSKRERNRVRKEQRGAQPDVPAA